MAKNWIWRDCYRYPPPKGVDLVFRTNGEVKELFIAKVEDHGRFHKGEQWMLLPPTK